VDAFLFLKYVTQLVTPPGLLAVGLVLGVVFAVVGFRRLGRFLATLGIVQAILFSLSPVADALLVPLENEARRLAAAAPGCCYDAIVVLGGAVRGARPPALPDPDLSDAADRVWHSARLFKRNVAPRIILSGGTPEGDSATSEAAAMRLFLLDLGVPDDRIVLEGRSINTIGNIRGVRAIVGDGRVALITSSYHMPRAMRLAKLGGLNAAAFPTDWRRIPGEQPLWVALLPSIDSMMDSWVAIKEHIAINLDFREGGLKP
jgi:uncharacterized SAM-binding protein YcdF (DUF218 family)